MDYAAAPVSFHVFALAVAAAQLFHAKIYGSQTCQTPLSVFLVVAGTHAMICSIIGLMAAHYQRAHAGKEPKTEDSMDQRAKALGIRLGLADSVTLSDKADDETLSMSASVTESIKFDESVDANSFMKKKPSNKKPGKGGKGKGGNGQGALNESLSLIGSHPFFSRPTTTVSL